MSIDNNIDLGILDGTAPLSALIQPDAIPLDIKGSQEDILKCLTQPLVDLDLIKDGQRSLFLEQLTKRENLCSTGLGDGIAIPHPRMPMPGLFPKPLIIMGISKAGLDYQALDGKPSHCFFLVCVSRDDIHLRLLNKIAKLSQQGLVNALKNVNTTEEVIPLLQQLEQKMENT